MPIEPYSGDPVTISAVITAGLKAHLLDLGGGNLSAGLRLQMAQPTTTPSKAVWCSHPEQLPQPQWRQTGRRRRRSGQLEGGRE